MKLDIIRSCIIIVLLIFSINSFAEELKSKNFDKGKELYLKGKFQIALYFFKKAIEEDPLNPQLYFYLGNIYNHREEFDKSIDAFLKGIDLADEKNDYYYNLAKTYRSAKKHEKALQTFRKLLSRTDAYPESYYYIGLINFKLKNKEDTISNLETYLAKKPDSPQYETIEKVIKFLKENDDIWKKKPSGNVQYVPFPMGYYPQGGIPQGLNAEQYYRDMQSRTPNEMNQGGVNNALLDIQAHGGELTVGDQSKKEGPEFDEIER